MKKILLPTDFSDSARKAIQYALLLFGDKDYEFTLLNAFRPPHSAGMLISIDDFVEKDAEKSLKEELTYIRNTYGYEKANIKLKTSHGFAKDIIIAVAEQKKMDLVVMGTKGATGLKETFLGSNAAYVARRSEVPVLTVPDEIQLQIPRKIVLAVDFNSNLNVESLEPLVNLAIEFNAHVDVLQVLTVEKKQETFELKKDQVEHFLQGIDFGFHFINSPQPIDGIEAFIKKNKPDILALVPMEINFFDGLFGNSVTRKMEMHSNIPLLALHNIEG